MVYKIFSIGKYKEEPLRISIETNIRNGIPAFDIIGKTDKTIQESRARVLSTLKNLDKKALHHKKIVTLLSPAHIEKTGSLYDLSIAISCYSALRPGLKNINILKVSAFVGELDLNGNISIGYNFFDASFFSQTILSSLTYIFLPEDSKSHLESLNIPIKIIYIKSFKEVIEYLYSDKDISKEYVHNKYPSDMDQATQTDTKPYLIDQIQGLQHLKRTLAISLAGRHHLLMIGSPGSGKSALLDCVFELFPNTQHIQLNKFQLKTGVQRVNHSIQKRSLIGDEHSIGEIAFAHGGCILLDEFFECNKSTLSSLREPMEDGFIQYKNKVVLTDFILISATNPCDCGNHKSKYRCVCSRGQIEKYIRKTKTPLFDRIDMICNVNTHVQHEKNHEILRTSDTHTSGEFLKRRIEHVQKIQREREVDLFKNNNAGLSSIKTHYEVPETETVTIHKEKRSKRFLQIQLSAAIHKNLSAECLMIIDSYTSQKSVSTRHLHSILLVARTIADFDNSDDIQTHHLIESIQYKKDFFTES